MVSFHNLHESCIICVLNNNVSEVQWHFCLLQERKCYDVDLCASMLQQEEENLSRQETTCTCQVGTAGCLWLLQIR